MTVVGVCDITFSDNSTLPQAIKSIYIPHLKKMLCDIFATLPQTQYFPKIDVNLTNVFATPPNIEDCLLLLDPHDPAHAKMIEVLPMATLATAHERTIDIYVDALLFSIFAQNNSKPDDLLLWLQQKLPLGMSSLQGKYKSILEHELTHLVHMHRNSKLFKAYERKVEGFHRFRDRKFSALDENTRDYTQIYLQLRSFLEHFELGCMTEGIAQYQTELPPPDPRRWKESYIAAALAVTSLQTAKNSFLKSLGGISIPIDRYAFDMLVELLEEAMYPVGFHMTYTLMFKKAVLDPILYDMKPQDFFNGYEQIMRSGGHQPLISLSSGHGVLDIESLHKELDTMRLHYKKKFALTSQTSQQQ